MSHKQRALGVVRRRLILIGVLEKTSDLALTHSLPVNRILTTLWAIWGGVQRITHNFFNPLNKHICVPSRVQNFLLRESSAPSHHCQSPLLPLSTFLKLMCCWFIDSLASLSFGGGGGSGVGVCEFSTFCIIFPFSLSFHLRN